MPVLLLFSVCFALTEATSNFKCKNGSSDWPLPCHKPRDALKQMRFNKLPITAWWGPAGYGGGETPTAEYVAYAKAGFTTVMVSDRGSDRCNNVSDIEASWQFIQQNIEHARAYNMTALIDTYRCLPWGSPDNIGGDWQAGGGHTPGGSAGGGGFVSARPHQPNHKITLPEVQWLAKQVQHDATVVGLLITDDGVDLARNEIEETEWMLEHTPELLPWSNQCDDPSICDGSEWLARAGTPYMVPELYAVKGPGGDAVAMSQAQLALYDSWQDKGNRFGMDHFPLINIGDGGDTGLVRSDSLTRFQA